MKRIQRHLQTLTLLAILIEHVLVIEQNLERLL